MSVAELWPGVAIKCDSGEEGRSGYRGIVMVDPGRFGAPEFDIRVRDAT